MQKESELKDKNLWAIFMHKDETGKNREDLLSMGKISGYDNMMIK